MYVCTLKVAGDRHGLTLQPKKGGIVDFGFVGSQNSAASGGREGREGGFHANNRAPVEDNDSSEKSD